MTASKFKSISKFVSYTEKSEKYDISFSGGMMYKVSVSKKLTMFIEMHIYSNKLCSESQLIFELKKDNLHQISNQAFSV